MTNPKYDIYDRVFKFAVEVVKSTRLISRSDENKVIVAQLLRSVTSMGANAEEADGSVTKKDFLHCFTIVRKEGKETIFWLRLLGELNANLAGKMTNLVIEAESIVAIVSKVISKTGSH